MTGAADRQAPRGRTRWGPEQEGEGCPGSSPGLWIPENRLQFGRSVGENRPAAPSSSWVMGEASILPRLGRGGHTCSPKRRLPAPSTPLALHVGTTSLHAPPGTTASPPMLGAATWTSLLPHRLCLPDRPEPTGDQGALLHRLTRKPSRVSEQWLRETHAAASRGTASRQQ